MKKFLWVLLPLMLMLSACSDDDDKNNIPSDHPILGTWVLSDYEARIVSESDELTNHLKEYVMDDYLDDNPSLRGSTITFQQNGKAILNSYPDGETNEIKFSLNESVLTFHAYGTNMSVLFEIEGNTLQSITNILTECKRYAISKGYGSVYEAEFVETYTFLN